MPGRYHGSGYQPADQRLIALPRPVVIVVMRCRNRPYLDQGGTAARRRGPAIALGLRPWRGPGRARARPHAFSLPLMYWAHPDHASRSWAVPSSSAVSLSRSRPSCLGRPSGPSHAIGFAEPRHDVHSRGIGAYRGRRERNRISTQREPCGIGECSLPRMQPMGDNDPTLQPAGQPASDDDPRCGSGRCQAAWRVRGAEAMP
jgi:hypothetical protein